MSDVPFDLIPLGVVHNDERRAAIMAAIERQRQRGALPLWGFEGWRGVELKPVPLGYELIWQGGPSREEGHPNFPGQEYYCDVTAEPRGSHPKGLPRTELRISEKALNEIRANMGDEKAPAAPSEPSEHAIIGAPTPALAPAAPQPKLVAWMKKIANSLKRDGKPDLPVPDITRDLWPRAKNEFECRGLRVTRKAAQEAAQEVFGKLDPGKRQ